MKFLWFKTLDKTTKSTFQGDITLANNSKIDVRCQSKSTII